jgi:hypothetical protein
MGGREQLGYVLIGLLLLAAGLLIWRVRHGQHRAHRGNGKHVRIDLMRRSEGQLDEETDGSR